MGYLQRRKIPQYFQKVVLDYYAYMSEKLSQDAIVQELPVTIQASSTSRRHAYNNESAITHILG